MGAPPRTWLARILVAIVVVAVFAANVSLPLPLWTRAFLLSLCAAVAGAVAYRLVPAFDPLGRVRWRVPSAAGSAPRCAITFDDGPTTATSQVLDILAAEGVPATFFVLGRNVERYPHTVRRAQSEGHAIGVHGMDHSRLAGANESTIAAQVAGVARVLEAAGVSPAAVYRTPHGWKSPGVFAAARRQGLTLWAWSRGVWDTDRPSPDVIVRRATRFARSGMVLLLHDGRGDDPQPDVAPMLAALPEILRELKRRGFAFVRLADV
ncbi:MAG TPA: polysaccharide deacetylase family protein [Vicinamibacterales bacterium]|jgi:peptidoglycan/xylan/chitin deacetylase (PgdA/CDA1 family)